MTLALKIVQTEYTPTVLTKHTLCGRKCTHNYYKCYGKFAFKSFFELLIFQSGMNVQNTPSIILKNKNWV